MADKCAFIILSHNSGSYLLKCLESVLSVNAVEPYIYIADNGSGDDSVGVIEDLSSRAPGRVCLIKNGKNLGTTVPRNELAKRAVSDHPDLSYICVLDSDTVINDEAVEGLRKALDNDPEIAIASPRMFNGENIEQMSVKHFPTVRGKMMKAMPFPGMEEKGRARESYDFFPARDLRSDILPPVSTDGSVYIADYAISACWFMRADVFLKYGYLDEKIFYAPEDVDFCHTVFEKGGKTALVSGVSIYHLTQRISKKKLFSRMNFLHIKGLLRYWRKH